MDTFDDMFVFVKQCLSENDGVATKIGYFPFRKRSEHIWRVFQWVKRLIDDDNFDVAIDRDSVLIAALFHDVGYTLSLVGAQHAENSAVVFNRYAIEKKFDKEKQAFISYLIQNHSQKSLFDVGGTPLELIILMEADLLDETGAMSIVWDCMAEGGQDEQSFAKTYNKINSFSHKTLNANPMKTAKAKEFWVKKQALLQEFLDHLAVDLAIKE